MELAFSGLLLASSVLIHATVLTLLFRRSSRWPALTSRVLLLHLADDPDRLVDHPGPPG
jgi:hypothetical protein